jgi:membrane associated rhomboid family serine protease
LPTDPRSAPPINPLPVVVWILALPMIAMEVVLTLADRGLFGARALGWRLEAVERFAFSPELLRFMAGNGVWPLDGLWRLVTHAFVHGSFTHALFVVVILLALGKMVGEAFRPLAVVAIFLGSAAVGAVVYTVLLPGVVTPLVGGYPATYGLIGGFTFLLWVNLARVGANRYRAFSLIGLLLGVQLLFGVLFGGGWEWVADLAGFATGFLLSFVVSPGGWARVRDRLRGR